MFRWLLCFSLAISTLVASEEDLEQVIQEIPAAGLILDVVEFQGLQISDFAFDNGKQYVDVEPGDEVTASFRYVLQSRRLKNWESHHFIWALSPEGPSGCFLSSFGLRDREGIALITFTAPEDAGAYFVRVGEQRGVTCRRALRAWDQSGNASSAPMLGILLVK